MIGFLPQSTEAFTSGCPFSIDAPSSVEALFRRESMPPTSSSCRQTTTGGAKSGELSDGSFDAQAPSDPQLSLYSHKFRAAFRSRSSILLPQCGQTHSRSDSVKSSFLR